MPNTIDAAFNSFLTRLTPTEGETEAAKSHRASIESCLASNFGILSFYRCGSFGNGTSISGYSDVDYMAWVPIAAASDNSSVFLSETRDALSRRFPSTGVRVNTPAVKVPFGVSAQETTEVVPGIYGKGYGDAVVYRIADGSGGWMFSCPEAHNAYVREADARHNGKVKPLIRFMKAWKYYRSVPILSFYLEMFVTAYSLRQTSIVYSIDIEFMFKELSASLYPITDPLGISGAITPCSTDANLVETRGKLQEAAYRAEEANRASRQYKVEDAFEWWDRLFYYEFPVFTP